MEDLRCKCGKIVCQIKGNLVIIKCRHCKRLVIVNTKGIINEQEGKVAVEYR